MEKIVEALTKLLPEDSVKDISEAVKVELEKAKQECEQEYNSKLEEAYAELSKELKGTKRIRNHNGRRLRRSLSNATSRKGKK